MVKRTKKDEELWGRFKRRFTRREWIRFFGGHAVISGGVDTIAPTVVITSTTASPSGDATFPITITFSENVTGFEVGDITVSGFTLSDFSGSGATYTVTATPTLLRCTLDIAAGVCADAAGNVNTAASQFVMNSTRGLTAYWKMDEVSNGSGAVTRNDSVGASHLTDNSPYAASGTGKIGNGVDFESSNAEFLSIADNAALSTGDIDFTIAAWINLETVAAITMGLVCKWVATKQEYALWFTTSKIQFSVSNDGTALNTLEATAFGNLSTGTWYFVVAWHDSVANTINVQINNGTAASKAHTTGVANTDGAFTVGRLDLVTVATSADGIIDEVGFWKRVLTAAERTALYNGGSGNTYPFDSSAPGVGFEVTTTTIGGQSANYLVPNDALSGVLVIYCHGTGESETAWNNGIKTYMRDALIAEGHILAASNAHGENWGNSDSITDHIALYNDAAARFTVSKVILISQSMGGIGGLLLVEDGTIPVDGWAGIYPACDLAWCYANGFTAAINTAYGISGDYAAKTAGHDPVLLDGTNFTCGVRFYASAADVTITKADNSDAMALVVADYAAENDVVVCTGVHGDPSHFQPADVVAFIGRCIA